MEELGTGEFPAPAVIVQKLPPARIGIFSERATSGSHGPPSPDIQLPKRFKRARSLPKVILPLLPTSDHPTTSKNHGFFRCGPIDYPKILNSRIFRPKSEGLGKLVHSTAKDHHDVALHVFLLQPLSDSPLGSG
jgi:hypothetical protein